ncbi:MAG: type II toxin-antitoxin system VapB family antitoxin [Rectinemataceae bacterium]
MALSIRNPEVERLARDLARRSGATMTEVIVDALEAKLSELEIKAIPRRAALADIAAECAALPDLDSRSAEEILGYGENGGFADGD